MYYNMIYIYIYNYILICIYISYYYVYNIFVYCIQLKHIHNMYSWIARWFRVVHVTSRHSCIAHEGDSLENRQRASGWHVGTPTKPSRWACMFFLFKKNAKEQWHRRKQCTVHNSTYIVLRLCTYNDIHISLHHITSRYSKEQLVAQNMPKWYCVWIRIGQNFGVESQAVPTGYFDTRATENRSIRIDLNMLEPSWKRMFLPTIQNIIPYNRM